MKNLYVLIILIFQLLSSCYKTPSKRINCLIEGKFISKDNNLLSYMEIEEIDKTTYELQEGLNVIHDLAIDKFYKLIFYYTEDEKNFVYIDFLNFKDKNNGAEYIPLQYIDDYKTELWPGLDNFYPGNIFELYFNLENFTFTFCFEIIKST